MQSSTKDMISQVELKPVSTVLHQWDEQHLDNQTKRYVAASTATFILPNTSNAANLVAYGDHNNDSSERDDVLSFDEAKSTNYP